MTTLTIQIASVPDHPDVVAEIWIGDEQLADLSRGIGGLLLEAYGRREGTPWWTDPDTSIAAIR